MPEDLEKQVGSFKDLASADIFTSHVIDGTLQIYLKLREPVRAPIQVAMLLISILGDFISLGRIRK